MKTEEKSNATFTDDDIKMVKEECSYGFTWRHFKIIYLINRLEAAERWAHAERSTTLLASPEYLEWRKTAGK